MRRGGQAGWGRPGSRVRRERNVERGRNKVDHLSLYNWIENNLSYTLMQASRCTFVRMYMTVSAFGRYSRQSPFSTIASLMEENQLNKKHPAT
jgi:hypothetical protein